jgi:3-isopropylmalate/(R)-2-methylmalate dehydratase large subunit
MANMAIEAGAKTGIFWADNIILDYIKSRSTRHYSVYESDVDAEYSCVIEYDVGIIEPQIALPHSPANTRPVSQLSDIKIDQAMIGSCTNGRLEDLRNAAIVLEGRKVHSSVRCIVIPGTQQVYLDALNEGLIEIFIRAGVVVSTPTCGPCLGGHMGILAAGERCISTTNRNFTGRMGSPESEVYLSNPAVAAASAVAGRIASPEEFVG